MSRRKGKKEKKGKRVRGQGLWELRHGDKAMRVKAEAAPAIAAARPSGADHKDIKPETNSF